MNRLPPRELSKSSVFAISPDMKLRVPSKLGPDRVSVLDRIRIACLADQRRPPFAEVPLGLEGVVSAAQFEVSDGRVTSRGVGDEVVELEEARLGASPLGTDESAAPVGRVATPRA